MRVATALMIATLGLPLVGVTSSSADTHSLTVPGQANIFGAGHPVPPDPGGGGGGVLPPFVPLPSGPNVFVRIASASGSACCSIIPVCFDNPDGGLFGSYDLTNITSYGGISGIQHGNAVMFLTGAFLSDQEPADPAPDRLNFGTGGLSDNFLELSPVLNQTFFIGDGMAQGVSQIFRAPAGATRLYLGFADAWNFGDPIAAPGSYNDNSGNLSVEVEVGVDGPIPTAKQTLGRLKAMYR